MEGLGTLTLCMQTAGSQVTFPLSPGRSLLSDGRNWNVTHYCHMPLACVSDHERPNISGRAKIYFNVKWPIIYGPRLCKSSVSAKPSGSIGVVTGVSACFVLRLLHSVVMRFLTGCIGVSVTGLAAVINVRIYPSCK